MDLFRSVFYIYIHAVNNEHDDKESISDDVDGNEVKEDDDYGKG